MATYNRAHLIGESLESIINQSYLNWECLIIDDGSKDNTAEVLSIFVEHDERIKYFLRSDTHKKGLPGCRNYGIENATGDFIVFFDDDDIVHPDNLLHCTNKLRVNTYDFCRYTREVFSGEFNIEFDRGEIHSEFFIDNSILYDMLTGRVPFNSCAIMWRKSVFKNEMFNEKLMYAEEWELYSRILSNGAKGISLNKTLFYGRKHANSNTGEFYDNNPIRKKSKAEAIKLISKNLAAKKMLSAEIRNYFIQLGMYLHDSSVVKKVVSSAKMNYFERKKTLLKYALYPFYKFYSRILRKIGRY